MDKSAIVLAGGSSSRFGEDKGVWRAVRNLPGVDACRVDKLNAELLAPGGDAGRLCVFTQNALNKMNENGLYL